MPRGWSASTSAAGRPAWHAARHPRWPRQGPAAGHTTRRRSRAGRTERSGPGRPVVDRSIGLGCVGHAGRVGLAGAPPAGGSSGRASRGGGTTRSRNDHSPIGPARSAVTPPASAARSRRALLPLDLRGRLVEHRARSAASGSAGGDGALPAGRGLAWQRHRPAQGRCRQDGAHGRQTAGDRHRRSQGHRSRRSTRRSVARTRTFTTHGRGTTSVLSGRSEARYWWTTIRSARTSAGRGGRRSPSGTRRVESDLSVGADRRDGRPRAAASRHGPAARASSRTRPGRRWPSATG